MNVDAIAALVDSYEQGRALAAPFFTDPDVWAADQEMLAPQWHLVGHAAEIPEPGDTKVLTLFGESIIVVRGQDDVIRAFYNVCPHRGARLCSENRDGLRQLTCPYHSWSFGLDGEIKAAQLKVRIDGFDAEAHNLTSCPIGELEGLLFVSLSDSPSDFGALFEPYRDLFRFYGLADTQVVRVVGYDIKSNWKIVVENSIDSYHVQSVHPAFYAARTPAMWRALGSTQDTVPLEVAAELDQEIDAWMSTLTQRPDLTGALIEDDADSEQFRWLVRLPLKPGFLSESRDGQLVAPLLGRLTEPDGAAVMANFNPLDSMFISSDYAVTFRVTATAHDRCNWEMTWLVHKDAVSGKDFDPDTVCDLHDETFKEDHRILELTYDGLTSKHFRPGRFTPQETHIGEFHQWYLRRLSEALGTSEAADA